MDELAQLAAFVAETQFEELPTAVVERAQHVMRDTVGVIVGAMAEPEVHALAEFAARTAPGPVTLLGHGGRTTADWAVLVHGTAGTTLEMDEGHAVARGHAAIHALPPALALGEMAQAHGRDVLTAFVVGYEVAARAGVATRLRPEVHPFGAWGVLGAAAVAARFKGYDAAAVADTLELAASYAITPSFDSAFQGANVRNTYAGVVNRLGLLAADLFALGFRGESGGLRTTFGRILGSAFDAMALADGLGTRYEIMRGYFKPYSACRYAHGAVDAVLGLQAAQAIDAGSITAVTVDTYDIAARLREPAPQTPLAGRFSLPYVVAATLMTGGAGPEIFRPKVLGDPAVRELAARVQVAEDPAFTALTPARRPARVTLTLGDGRVLSQTVMGSRGDPDQPLTEAELEAKFMQLITAVVGTERARQAWHRMGSLATERSLDATLGVLVPHAR